MRGLVRLLTIKAVNEDASDLFVYRARINRSCVRLLIKISQANLDVRAGVLLPVSMRCA